jgi:beta-glucanase (GH16 family)
MKTSPAFALPILALLFGVLCREPTPGQPAAEWKLTWSDEFDGTAVDRAKWGFDLGNGFFNYDANTWINGWGNNELQYYTDQADNVFVKDGMLHLRAIKESYLGCGYTSGKLKTRKKDGTPLFSQKYGRFEFRAKLPTGRGIWPAIWMLPAEEKYGGWAASGEIDILEARGQEPTKVLGTLHFGARWPNNAETSSTYVLPKNGTIADFHVYALEWDPGEIRWYLDGQLSATQNFWWSSSKHDGDKGVRPAQEADLNAWPAPFDRPFYLVINLAVGGRFLGNPDRTTAFPVEMLVDYVRVYEKVGGYGAPRPRGTGKLPFALR